MTRVTDLLGHRIVADQCCLAPTAALHVPSDGIVADVQFRRLRTNGKNGLKSSSTRIRFLVQENSFGIFSPVPLRVPCASRQVVLVQAHVKAFPKRRKNRFYSNLLISFSFSFFGSDFTASSLFSAQEWLRQGSWYMHRTGLRLRV